MADSEHVHPKVRRDVHRGARKRRSHLINRDGYWLFQKRIPSGSKSGRQQMFRLGLGRISEPEAIFLANLIKSAVEHLKSRHRLASIDEVGFDVGVGQMIKKRVLTDAGPVAVQLNSMMNYVELALLAQKHRAGLKPDEANKPIHFETDLKRFGAVCKELLVCSAEISMLPANSPVNAIGRKYLAALVETFDSDHTARQHAAAVADAHFQRNWDRLKSGDMPAPTSAGVELSSPAVSDIPTSAPENAHDEIRERPVIQKHAPAPETQEPHQPASDATDMLFSEAVDAYVSQRQLNNPHFQASTVTYPAKIWLELLGDRPMSRYGVRDLQAFVNFASKIPPKATKLPEFKGYSFAEIARANAGLRFGIPALKTVREGQVGNLKALFSHYFAMRQATSPMAGSRLTFPKSLAEPKSHERASPEVFATALKRGASSSNSVDFWMPTLLYATGRRIGLLTYLQPNSFSQRENGVWEAKVNATAETAAGRLPVPYKNRESLSKFVLPAFLINAGFVDWAQSRRTDFVFECAHRAADPSDYCSKRVNRLLTASAAAVNADRPSGVVGAGKAHGFRGALLDRLSACGIDPAVGEMQIGHKLPGVQGSYRRMTDAQAMQIFAAHPDIEFPRFDLSLAERLDRE